MTEPCTIDGCDQPFRARGLCNGHYAKARRAGTLSERPYVIGHRKEKFWQQVDKTGTCWLWLGHKTRDGYGAFMVDAKTRKAHRLAWQWLRGDVPDDMVLDHICRVRNCVNPDHLEVVTPKVNTLRGISFSAIYARATHCKSGHEFDAANTYLATTGQRVCRTCKNERNRKWRARQKERVA